MVRMKVNAVFIYKRNIFAAGYIDIPKIIIDVIQYNRFISRSTRFDSGHTSDVQCPGLRNTGIWCNDR